MTNLKYFAACLTDVGRKRNNNEDFVSYFEAQTPEEIAQSGNLYIVADGVGGAAKGERASSFATEKLLYEYYQLPDLTPAERLKRLMREAGNHIFEYAENETFGRMATTMVAAVVQDGKLIVAHVGDSRAYLLRGGQARQLTRDHSLVGEMIRDGTMTEEESMHSKVKNRLTRSLGGEENVHVDVTPEIDLEPGDRILLCTDGLTRYALPGDLVQMGSHGSPVQVVKRLIGFANSRGGADNVTSLLVTVHDQDEVIEWAATAAYPRPTLPVWAQETDESAGVVTKSLKPRRKQKYNLAIWIPASLVAFLLLGVAGFIAIASRVDSQTLLVAAVVTPSVVVNVQEPKESLMFSPANPTAASLSDANTPVAIVSLVPAVGLCDYKVQPNDTLSNIEAKLGLISPATLTCIKDVNDHCVDEKLKSRSAIKEDMILRFENVDADKCRQYGGNPISPIPPSPTSTTPLGEKDTGSIETPTP
jgi:PPM family protein phosphatase